MRNMRGQRGKQSGEVAVGREQTHIPHGQGSRPHGYKFSRKQVHGWKPLGVNLQQYLTQLVSSSVQSVLSYPKCRKEEEVCDLLTNIQQQLESKVQHMRVPKSKHCEYKNMKPTLVRLREDCQRLTDQQLLLERAIRQEERQIEKLTDEERATTGNNTSHDLILQVPANRLSLPEMEVNT